jgi:hypothetical protein
MKEALELKGPEPIPHNAKGYGLGKKSHHYRVVMYRDSSHDPAYLLWVGWGIKRNLSQKELPEELRSKLSMILAHPQSKIAGRRPDSGYIHKTLYTKDIKSPRTPFNTLSHGVYLNDYPEEFGDIGWRLSKGIFCMVLSSLCLDSLQGEKLIK